MHRLLSVFFFLCFALATKAQLSVENSATPENLVNEVILGEGVEAANITFNNGPADAVKTQFAYFNGGGPYIGIDSGVILATGRAEVAQGPNDVPTAHLTVPPGEQLNVDPDLQLLVGNSTLRDVAIVEFDFTARGDTLRFKYVFASEEYNDHTCSPYNDAFGFFISGPGIQGTGNFANNAKNVALVPGTNVPVAINTVNQGTAGQYGANSVCNAAYSNWQANSIYFVNNEGNPDPGTTQFDGFTVPFLIEIPVICGETYHIKLAIADAVDDKNDSAVFIEAGSFSSEAFIEADLSVELPDGEEGLALEGCSSYILKLQRADSTRAKTLFLRSRDLPNAQSILTDFPESVHFEVGEASKLLHFDTSPNGIYEGPRTWYIDILAPEACGLDTAVYSIEARITDRPLLELEIPDSLTVPCHESVAVQVIPQGGNPPYNIVWNAVDVEGWEVQASASQDTVLTGSVSDACNMHNVTFSISLQAEVYTELALELPLQYTYDCIEPAYIIPQLDGGAGEYTFSWTLNDSQLSTAPELNTTIPGPGFLVLEINDRCALTVTDSTEMQPLANPVQVNIGDDREGTCLEELLFVPEVIGGFGNLTYLWKLNQNEIASTSIMSFRPENTINVSLSVSDQCGQTSTDSIYVFVYDPPLEVHLPSDTVLCRGERLELVPEISGAMGNVSFYWPVSGGTMPTYVNMVQNARTYVVQVSDQCGRAAQASTEVIMSEVHANFAFDYDFPDNPIRNFSTPQCSYLWTFPDGSSSDMESPYFVPESAQVVPVMLTVNDIHGCEDSMVQFYDPPMSLFIPTAFSPDGNGLNDTFKAVGHNVADFHIWIFDKWGTLVFDSTDIDQGWNGEGTRSDDYHTGDNIYPYRYVARSWSGTVKEGTGSVMLLR